MPRSTPNLPPDLLQAITALPDVDALQRVLLDLLTPAELEAIGERWEIVKKLDQGFTQRAISETTGASVTTVSRGSRQIKYGHGGFALLLELLGTPADTTAGED